MKALSTRDIALEARTKFNLGNCAYADALEKQNDVKAALEQLRLAISYYKDAIAADPDDLDAKVNIETAQLLMKHLLDQEKNKQEEQKDKQNDDEQKDEQDDSPQTQPEQPQSQPASQPESDEKNDEQNEGGEKQDGEDQQDEQKEGQEQQKGDQEDQGGEDGKVEPQQQEGAEGEEFGDGQQGEEAQIQEMTPEQAENLLQKIRDRERERRAALLRLLQVEQVLVDKDW
jgi:Ca-activated chloride channel homolog